MKELLDMAVFMPFLVHTQRASTVTQFDVFVLLHQADQDSASNPELLLIQYFVSESGIELHNMNVECCSFSPRQTSICESPLARFIFLKYLD